MVSKTPPTSSFTTEQNTTDNTMSVPRPRPLVCSSIITHVTRLESLKVLIYSLIGVVVPRVERLSFIPFSSHMEYHFLIHLGASRVLEDGKCVQILFWAGSNFLFCQ